MKKILFLLFCFLSILTFSQSNIITNSFDWTDSNNDGLADFWIIGTLVTNCSVDSGFQYVSSNTNTCSQCNISQVINIQNYTIKKEYKLEFDLQSNAIVTVVIMNENMYGYWLSDIQPSEMKHYIINFEKSGSLYSLVFFNITMPYSWLKLDNVEMVEVFPVGISNINENFNYEKVSYFNTNGQNIKSIPNSTGLYFIKKDKKVKKMLYFKN
jgi:hypothetical protein